MNKKNLPDLIPEFLGILAGVVAGGLAWFSQDVIFRGQGGVLLFPLAGVVIGLAWRGSLSGAGVASLFPLVDGWRSGGPEAGGLILAAFLTTGLIRSVGEEGGIGLRGMIVVPLAAGVTLAAVLLAQMLSGQVPFSPGFGTLWAEQALGVMAFAPLVAKVGSDFLSQMNRRLFAGWLLLTVLLLAVGRIAADPSLDPATALALGLLPVVILFWQAMRFGRAGASTACFILALVAGLAWSDNNPALLSMPSGALPTLLATIFGTAYAIAALRDERLETHTWTSQAAEAYQVLFWRWQRGVGVDWDDPKRAAAVGLRRSGMGWTLCPGWYSDGELPDPSKLEGRISMDVRQGDQPSRWLDFSGVVHTRDSDRQPTTVLGVVFDVTASVEAERERARALRREGELRALRSQLQPHVVFNALNRIASLTMSDPPAARDLIVRLSRLLRAALLAGEKESVTLREEISLIGDCVALEGAGYGDRLRFRDEIPETTDLNGLPPLALLSLVNGAIRRGVGMRKKGATVTLSMPKKGVLRVSVQPPVPLKEDSEFTPWPDPVWQERLLVEEPLRARIDVQQEDGAVASADLVLLRKTG